MALRRGLACCLTAALGTSCTTQPPAVAAPPPAASVKTVMTALTERAASVLWDAETDEHPPRSDDDWRRLEQHAIQVALSGALVERGVAGPVDPAWAADPQWRKYLDEMLSAAAAAQAAAQARRMDLLSEANGRLLSSCEGCHRVFLAGAGRAGEGAR